MDARLVWDTWRRVLADDALVDCVLHSGASDAAIACFSVAERAVLADYASTPQATDTNIRMYRRGLVRNALAALSLVPLSQHLLYMSGLDVDAVAEDFVRSHRYTDEGPFFWRIADGFVAHLATRPELAAPAQQDVLALDAALVTLARRLGSSPVAIWPDTAATFLDAARQDRQSTRFVASPAAIVASSHHDLTRWLEDPQRFDPDEVLAPSPHQWLIYFPAADMAPAYAELSERSARAFDLLSAPQSAPQLSHALDGLPTPQVHTVIEALLELGVIVSEDGPNALAQAPQST